MKTTVELPHGHYRELRRILFEKEKTFAAWLRKKIEEEIRADRAGKK